MLRKHIPGVPGVIAYSMTTTEDFEAFARENDAFAINAALAENLFMGDARVAATIWVAKHDHAQAEAAAEAARSAQQRATKAAERSARWTMVAAIAAAFSALAAAAAVIVPLFVKK